MENYSLAHLSDDSLDRCFDTAFGRECAATAEGLAAIAESDARRRYLPAGYPSMVPYCMARLGLCEQAALKRIRAARSRSCSRPWPTAGCT